MVRTQIQLPDDLYRRAKRFSEAKEISLAELTRRGLELFLDRFPHQPENTSGWVLPQVDGGGLRVPLESLRDFSDEDSRSRSPE